MPPGRRGVANECLQAVEASQTNDLRFHLRRLDGFQAFICDASMSGGWGRLRNVHARSALFDVYGDHLLGRGGQAPVAALIRLLQPLGIRPPAVRTAISRMVTQGWLAPIETATGAGYALTKKGGSRMESAAQRIYRRPAPAWDGQWRVQVLKPMPNRAQRERVRNQLRFLGMAPISDSTWVGPRADGEVRELLAEEGLESVSMITRDVAPLEVVLRAFRTDELARDYTEWLAEAALLVGEVGSGTDEQSAFVVRSHLVHGWRKFLFTDPGLPAELLPSDWPGTRAAAYFDEHAARLLPPSSRFVEACLNTVQQGATR